MEIVFEIWLRLLVRYAEELFFQESSSGVFSFLIIGVLAYLYKQEKEQEKNCSCSHDKQKKRKRKEDRSSQ